MKFIFYESRYIFTSTDIDFLYYCKELLEVTTKKTFSEFRLPLFMPSKYFILMSKKLWFLHFGFTLAFEINDP